MAFPKNCQLQFSPTKADQRAMTGKLRRHCQATMGLKKPWKNTQNRNINTEIKGGSFPESALIQEGSQEGTCSPTPSTPLACLLALVLKAASSITGGYQWTVHRGCRAPGYSGTATQQSSIRHDCRGDTPAMQKRSTAFGGQQCVKVLQSHNGLGRERHQSGFAWTPLRLFLANLLLWCVYKARISFNIFSLVTFFMVTVKSGFYNGWVICKNRI